MSPPKAETVASAATQQAEETDGRRRRGRRTRESILDAAADVASIEGLEGLTLGRLATAMGISKSGLFAHFGSKEELQLATIKHGEQRFIEHVVRPSRALPRGRARLEALLRDWLAYYRGDVFEGGCFLDSVAAEFDSRPDGPVRSAVVQLGEDFRTLLTREIEKARDAGDLAPDTDADQLAFELKALGAAANQQFQMLGDDSAFERARKAIAARLDAAAA